MVSKKLSVPNYTQLPNLWIDDLIMELTGEEFKALIVIGRLTFGFHRESVKISFSEIEQRTGLSHPTAIKVMGKLLDMKLVERTFDPHDNTSIWTPMFEIEIQGAAKHTVNNFNKAHALAEILNVDFATNKPKLLSWVKQIPLDDGELRRLFGKGGLWYTLDWRGIKNSPPTLGQIKSEFARLYALEIEAKKKAPAAGKARIGEKGDLRV